MIVKLWKCKMKPLKALKGYIKNFTKLELHIVT